MSQRTPFPDVEVCVGRCDALDASERERVHALFEHSYAEANHSYLEKSLASLAWIARAERAGSLLGFTLSDVVIGDIPRLDTPQLTVLAGIGCVLSEERRSGLFSHIAGLAARANGLLESWDGARVLACGRMGHPAGFRSLLHFPTALPRAGTVLSDWHLEVGEAVARCYGVSLEPGTLVVRGDGAPIGHSNIEIDVSDEEWLPFEGVDRSRGDSLLGLAWVPDAPPGW